jgi:hypothetical protein
MRHGTILFLLAIAGCPSSGDGTDTGDLPPIDCVSADALCDEIKTWCAWAVDHDYFEGSSADNTYEECVTGYDDICVEFPATDACESDGFPCWNSCVDQEGPSTDEVKACIRDDCEL